MKEALIIHPKNDKASLPLKGHYRHTDFNGVDLSGYTFKGVDFSYANFRGSNLQDCKFHECFMFHTNFKGATMNEGTKCTHNGLRSPLEAGAYFDDNQKELLGLSTIKQR